MTRYEYMRSAGTPNSRAAHREYYAQFVTQEVRDGVLRHIGRERLLRSTDEHLNDIPLREWDRLAYLVNSAALGRAIREQGDWPSLGNLVCILKEAARQLVDDAHGNG